MVNIGQLMPEILSEEEQKFDEEWKVILSNKSEYPLSKLQALVLRQEIASGNRATVMFESFSISIPYIVEFFRVRRFLKDTYQLPAQASEKPYKPISPEKWEELKKELYKKFPN